MANAETFGVPIKVVLAGIPRLTAGMVRRCLRRQPDIEIVDCLRRAEALPGLVDSEAIDVVIAARTGDGVSEACKELLFREAAIPLIVITTDGRLEIYNRRVLREAAPDELLMEIRKVAMQRAQLAQI